MIWAFAAPVTIRVDFVEYFARRCPGGGEAGLYRFHDVGREKLRARRHSMLILKRLGSMPLTTHSKCVARQGHQLGGWIMVSHLHDLIDLLVGVG